MLPVTPLTVVILATVAIGVTASLLAWRERPAPGSLPLVAMLAGQTWWSVFLIFELEAETLARKILWSDVQWIGVVVIPVAWLLFALEYTGRDRYVRARYVALLAVVPVATLALAASGEHHDLLYRQSSAVEHGALVALDRSPGPWFWVVTAYTYLLGLAGSALLLDLLRSDAVPFRGQGIALLVGTIAPFASNFLYLAGAVPVREIDPTPIAFAVSGVAYLAALTRFRLLGTNPAPNHRARRLVFERMDAGAVVVDGQGFVVDLNNRAASILDATRNEALGRPASDVFPEYDVVAEAAADPGPTTLSDEDGSDSYDVTVTPIDDVHGRRIGRAITFHDVSDQLRRQQRLEVLNRLLRHNIRTETSVVYGFVDAMAEDYEREAAVVRDHVERIAEMGEKAREIVELFERAREPASPAPLSLLLGGVVEDVRDDHPSVTVSCGPIPDDVAVAPLLDAAFENVLENAAAHNEGEDPNVWIGVALDGEGDRVRITVADDGPGIDESELAVLDRGTETPLEHCTGLGLWLITWSADIAGGDVTFEANRPTGTVVTVEVPAYPTDADGRS